MTDQQIRTADPLSAAAIRARMRTGELQPWQVLLAADAGCPGAMAIMPAPGQPMGAWRSGPLVETALTRGMPFALLKCELPMSDLAWIAFATDRVTRWALQIDSDTGEAGA